MDASERREDGWGGGPADRRTRLARAVIAASWGSAILTAIVQDRSPIAGADASPPREPILGPSHVTVGPSTAVYGPAVGADSLSNAVVGGRYAQAVAYRFRATVSDLLEAVTVYVVDESNEGYGAGTGGTLRITIRPDDGSSASSPSDEILAELITDPGGGPAVEFAFPSPPPLARGGLYHAVFENVDPAATENYVSLNGLYVVAEERPWQPAFSDVDWAQLVRTPGAAWTDDPVPGDGTITPIMALRYASGRHAGLGYMEVWAGDAMRIGGKRRVREIFTISGRGRTVAVVAVRLKRLRGEDPLEVRLWRGRRSQGSLVFGGEIPASMIPIAPLEATGGSTWAELRLDEAVALDPGERYRLVLSSSGRTEYSMVGIREGSEYGYPPETYFADGTAQKSSPRGWGPIEGFGRPNEQGDLQFYLSEAGSGAAEGVDATR